MNWLSTEEIKRRAKISPEEALNVSVEHWEQICEAIKMGENIATRYSGEECGLCQRYHTAFSGKGCQECFLSDKEHAWPCCCEWKDFHESHTSNNAQAMLNRLYMERGKIYGRAALPYKKECKKEEVELRHGDYGDEGHDSWIKIYDKIWWLKGQKAFSCLVDKAFKNRTGNILDDLKRNAEDLREFKMDVLSQISSIYISSTKRINLEIINGCKTLYMSLEDATKIAHAILQEVATAKRDSSYKK